MRAPRIDLSRRQCLPARTAVDIETDGILGPRASLSSLECLRQLAGGTPVSARSRDLRLVAPMAHAMRPLVSASFRYPPSRTSKSERSPACAGAQPRRGGCRGEGHHPQYQVDESAVDPYRSGQGMIVAPNGGLVFFRIESTSECGASRHHLSPESQQISDTTADVGTCIGERGWDSLPTVEERPQTLRRDAHLIVKRMSCLSL